MEVYHSGDFQAERKGDDSPLTLADRRAHDVIVRHLLPTGIPILSEEGKHLPYDQRRHWKQCWVVDPLDGTKEFIKRNGEFAVNIALVEDGKPVLGVIALPVSGEICYASKGEGVFEIRNGEAIRLDGGKTRSPLRIIASRSHRDPKTQTFIDGHPGAEIVSRGSSIKFVMLARGEADIYPRFAPTMEWDTAAGQIIVAEAGFVLLKANTNLELTYNREDLLNPHFVVRRINS